MLTGSPSDDGDTRSTRANWWLVIAVRAASFLAWVLPLAVLNVYQSSPLNLVYIPSLNAIFGAWSLVLFGGIVYLIPLLSGVAFYFDRKYVAAASDWTPSLLYYLMALPSLVTTDVLSLIYLYQRHRYVGTP